MQMPSTKSDLAYAKKMDLVFKCPTYDKVCCSNVIKCKDVEKTDKVLRIAKHFNYTT